jgi:hypothetical protein
VVQVTLGSTFGKPAAVMAPASNSTKTLQQNRPRPTVPKAIIPAIPLPYIQKRRQQQAVREKTTEEAIQVPQTAVIEAPTSPTPPTTEIAPSVINGSSDSHATEKVEEVNEPSEVEAATAPVFEEDVVGKSANGEQEESVEETMGEQDCSTSIDRSISNTL